MTLHQKQMYSVLIMIIMILFIYLNICSKRAVLEIVKFDHSLAFFRLHFIFPKNNLIKNYYTNKKYDNVGLKNLSFGDHELRDHFDIFSLV